MMQAIASIGLSNAAVAVIMAMAVFVVTRVWRSPPLAHALWLLVLLKFIAPPLVGVALRVPIADSLRTPPADISTVPPVEARTATPIDSPSASQMERRGELLSDKPANNAVTSPEPSPASEQFDPWIRPAPPSPPDQSFPAELPSELVAAAPLTTDPATLDDGEGLRDAPATAASSQSFDQSVDQWLDKPVDHPIDRPLDTPFLGNSLNFDSLWPYVVGVWLAGASIWFAAVGVRLRRFGRLLKRTDAAPDWLHEEVAGLAARIGLRSVPDVRLVDAAIPPLAWAMFGRPLLLLPRELIGRLDADERMTLLAHELAHLRRRDHLTRWLEIVVLGLYWWQPVAWFARRQLHRAAEQCCDAWVVQRFPQHTRAYAQALFKTVEFLADAEVALPVGATGFSQANLLERRFAMILQGRRTDRLSRAVRYGLLLVGLVILPLSIRSLWADETQPEESAPVPATAPADAQPESLAVSPSAASGTEAPTAGAPVATNQPATAPPAPVATNQPLTAPALEPPVAGDPSSSQFQPPMAVPPAAAGLPAGVSGIIASEPALDPPTPGSPSRRARNGGSSDLDERLSRLEATVETLVRELRSRPIKPRPPLNSALSGVPTAAPMTTVPATTVPMSIPPSLESEPTRTQRVDSNNINERLTRLEAAVQTLVRELRSRLPTPQAPGTSDDSRQGTYGPPMLPIAPASPALASRNLPQQPAPDSFATDNLPRVHDRISAPVYYKQQTLIVVSRAGVAAIEFGDTFDDGHDSPEIKSDPKFKSGEAPNAVSYRYRFLPSTGGEEQSGKGQAAERYTKDPSGQWSGSGDVLVTAGQIAIVWSRGGKDRGWVYYTPEDMAVMIVNSHYDTVAGRGDAVEKLDLKRFRGLIR